MTIFGRFDGAARGLGSLLAGACLLLTVLGCGSEESSAGPNPESGNVDYGARGLHEVLIEENAGAAFRNDVADDVGRCTSFINSIDPNSPVAKELTEYPADMDRQLYTLYRPARLEAGKKYPVITWGNGTCAQPRLYVELLSHLASHGFLVIATNWRWTGGGVEMQRGLDFVLAENDNAQSA